MQHDAQLEAAYDEVDSTYSYHSYFTHVSPIIQSVDLALVNLELTLAGEPYSGYPQFCAPDELAEAIDYAGFDIVVTANNHSCDKGKIGIERTIDVLKKKQLIHTGTFKTMKSRNATYPLIVERNGFRLAFLNYTYGTNHIDVPPPNVVNIIDSASIIEDLNKAYLMKADATIVTLHWGNEYDRLESQGQRDIANMCLKHGATLVIGSHPHVIQPMKMESGRLVVYSLGNYISNQRSRYKDGGAMVYAELVKIDGSVYIDSAGYILTWVYIEERGGNKNYMIIPASLKEDARIIPDMDQSSKEKMELFVNDSRTLMKKHNTNVNEILVDSHLTNVRFYRDTTYSIQLLVSSDSSLTKMPARFRDQLTIEPGEKVYKYLVGSYFDYYVACGFRDYYKKEGFEDAFVVTYYRDQRLKEPAK